MEVTEKVEKPTFVRALKKLNEDERVLVTKLICERNKWSAPLFTMKKQGDRGLTPMEKDVVVTAFRLMGLDAFSGDTLSHEK